MAFARNEIVNVAPWQVFATVEGIATWRMTVFCLCARRERRRSPAEVMPRLAAVPVQPARLVVAAILAVGAATLIGKAYVFVIVTLSGRRAPDRGR